MKKLNKRIKEYFTVTEKEANGIIVMAILIVSVLFIPWIFKQFYFGPEPEEEMLKTQQFVLEVEQVQLVDYQSEILKTTYKSIDPNTTPVEIWLELGLQKHVAERIEKFREKGGRFKVKSDLLKIYGFPEETFYKIYNCLDLPELENDANHNSVRTSQSKKNCLSPNFNLNCTDTVQLIKIRGIGPVLSQRIIRFRNSLGGFVEEKQLYEVYGLDSTIAEEIMKKAYISPDFSPEKVKINRYDARQLSKHPYLNYEQAKKVVKLRVEKKILTPEDLNTSRIFSEEQYIRLAPYLEY